MPNTGVEVARRVLKRKDDIGVLKGDIATHFATHWSVIKDTFSGEPKAVDIFEMELDPDFGKLARRIRRLGMSEATVRQVVRDTVFQGDVDQNHVSSLATRYAQSYLIGLKKFTPVRKRSS